MTLGLPFAFDENTLHLGEFLPPLLAANLRAALPYLRRVLTLRREGRPVPGWRVASIRPLSRSWWSRCRRWRRESLMKCCAQTTEHILIGGEICSLFIVLG